MTFTAAGDAPVLEPVPGEFRLWSASCVQALFRCGVPDGTRELCTRACARLALPLERVSVRPVADKCWEREWLKDFHAMRFGTRLWVCPRHEAVSRCGGARRVPGPGTGVRHGHPRQHARCA